MSPRNVRGHTHKISPALLLKYELMMDDTYEHANVDGEKPMRHQSYKKFLIKKLGKAGSGRGVLLLEEQAS